MTRRRLRSAGERARVRAAAMGAAAAEADRTLFVGNLDPKVTEELIFELFHQAGPVVKVKIPRDRDGRPKQFAFVNFKHEESVPYGLSLLNGIKLYGRPMKIQFRSGSSHASQDGNPSCSPHGAANASPAHPASCGRYDRSPEGTAAAGFPAVQRPLPPDTLQRQLKNVPWQHAPPFGKYEPPGFSFPPPPHAFPPAPRRPELPAPRKGRLGAHPYLPESRRFGERGKREELGAEERDEHRYRVGRDELAYEERQRDGWSHDYRRDGYRDVRWHPARH
ncbi:RNA-binding protein 7 isoform X2 [Patagioenas fasciata]|uniref:RNA-binding protein 7 isoform X2 n=1 Tax=Patagioenas fasciata TaxID=372321 RepID=UPI0032E8D836